MRVSRTPLLPGPHTFTDLRAITGAFLLAFLVGCFLVACNGSSSNSFFARALIGPEGGMLVSGDGMLTLEVPAGAISDPTEISVTRESSDAPGLLLYEFAPAGLNFQVPARMTVDVSSIMSDSSAEDLTFGKLPSIITTASDGEGVEVLGDLTLLADSESNSFFLGGNVSHFSRFAVGGNTNATVGIEGVPEFWPANTAFGPVQVMVSSGAAAGFGERLSTIDYIDSSVAPVFVGGNSFRSLFPLPGSNETKTYSIPYRCGPPGVGLYRVNLTFTANMLQLVTEYTPQEVNIASAFLFGAAGPVLEGGESRTRYAPKYTTYLLRGSREVNCGGSAPVDPTPEATPPGGELPPSEPTLSPDPTIVVTPEPTVGGSVPPTPTPAAPTEDPPTISTGTSQVSISHTVGETECPTNASPILVNTGASNPLAITISENLPFLNVSPSSANTSGGQAQFVPSFPCSGFQIGANTGTISISAVDTVSGLSSNTLQIPVSVTVQQ